MKRKLLHDDEGETVYAVIFDKGDEVTAGLTSFAREAGLGGAQMSFDYRIRPGIARSTNALRLLDTVGLGEPQ